MGPLDATWHLLNALAAPLGIALIASAAVRLIWRHASAHRSFPGLAAVSYVAAATAHFGAWAWTGVEGSMLGYGLIVAATALALWWRVFLSPPPPPLPGGNAAAPR